MSTIRLSPRNCALGDLVLDLLEREGPVVQAVLLHQPARLALAEPRGRRHVEGAASGGGGRGPGLGRAGAAGGVPGGHRGGGRWRAATPPPAPSSLRRGRVAASGVGHQGPAHDGVHRGRQPRAPSGWAAAAGGPAALPVSSSNRMAPSEYTSEAGVGRAPRASSGAKYSPAGLPRGLRAARQRGQGRQTAPGRPRAPARSR